MNGVNGFNRNEFGTKPSLLAQLERLSLLPLLRRLGMQLVRLGLRRGLLLGAVLRR